MFVAVGYWSPNSGITAALFQVLLCNAVEKRVLSLLGGDEWALQRCSVSLPQRNICRNSEKEGYCPKSVVGDVREVDTFTGNPLFLACSGLAMPFLLWSRKTLKSCVLVSKMNPKLVLPGDHSIGALSRNLGLQCHQQCSLWVRDIAQLCCFWSSCPNQGGFLVSQLCV